MFSIQLNLSRALNFQPMRMRSSVNHASSRAEKSKNENRAIKKISSKIPGALIAVVAGILVVTTLGLDQSGVSIVREIPEGLPAFSLPAFSLGKIAELIPLALTISVVAFMESYSVAKAIEAKKRDYKVVPNQELVALGAANLIGSLFQSYPVTGGFSRSAVNYQSGANTSLS